MPVCNGHCISKREQIVGEEEKVPEASIEDNPVGHRFEHNPA